MPVTLPQAGGSFDPGRDVALGGSLSVAGTINTTGAMVGPFTAESVTATGATGTTATMLSTSTPDIVIVTGASGAGVQLPTGAAIPGALYIFKNMMTGVLKIYAVGGTINGTTGTTAVSVTATGNLGGMIVCATAGQWQVVPIPT